MERGMVDVSVAKQLVEAIIANLPAPVPGRRPVHTIGMGVKGKFVASDVARTYCIAEHFNGQPVDVSVNCTVSGAVPELGVPLKLAVGGGGLTVM